MFYAKNRRAAEELYGGPVIHPVMAIWESKEVQRLADLSIQSGHWRATTEEPPTSRLEHTDHGSRLAWIATEHPSLRWLRPYLIAGLLIHDTNLPGLGHLPEGLQSIIWGLAPEQVSLWVIERTDICRYISRLGLNRPFLARLVTNQLWPLSELVNGQSIDLDNLTNTLDYNVGMKLATTASYSPKALASCFRLIEGRLCLAHPDLDWLQNQLQGWASERQIGYAFIYGEANLNTNSRTLRALDLAWKAGRIRQDFFRLTDDQALEAIAETTESSKRLVSGLLDRQPYQLLCDRRWPTPSNRLQQQLDHPTTPGRLADLICQLANLPDWAISVQSGRNRGHKEITLPIWHNGRFQPPPSLKGAPKEWFLSIFLAPEFQSRAALVKAAATTLTEHLDSV